MVRLSSFPLGSITLTAALLMPQAVLARAAQPPANSAVADPVLRVLVFQGEQVRLRPALAAAGLRLRDAQGRVLEEFNGQVVLQAEPVNGWLRFSRPDAADSEQWQAREMWLDAVAGAEDSDPGLWLGQRRYRGRFQLRLEAGRLQVVNHVPLEVYLPSVVGSEMPASWPLEALRAQAVAARTYALKARKPAALFDLQAPQPARSTRVSRRKRPPPGPPLRAPGVWCSRTTTH